MPKVVTEEERALIKEAIHEKTVKLIREKGLKAVTVDDIAGSAGIGKGSFYTYYPTRETCLYEVVSRWEKEAFSRLETIMSSIHSDKEKAVRMMNELYLSPESLLSSIDPLEYEVMLRKLPAECRAVVDMKSEYNFRKGLELMNLSEQRMEVVALLTDCLNYTLNSKASLYNSTDAKQKAAEVLIEAIIGYITN
jgi:AcrR family transcriptional regulator